MAETTLSAMPCHLVAGDTLALRLSASGYSAADGWAADITAMVPGTIPIVFTTGTPDAGAWLFEEDTSAWFPGVYDWRMQVSKGGETHTVDGGKIQIKPALAAGVDIRSDAEKALAAISAYITGNISAPMAEHRVGDATGYRMVKEWPLTDLLKLQAYYQRLVNREQGKGLGIRTIPVRFVRV
jgi:hypothetical protein